MGKRIQPKLHNNRAYLDTLAYSSAANEAAAALLRYLCLVVDGDAKYRDIMQESAVRSAGLLLDYLALQDLALQGGGDGPEYYLDLSIGLHQHHATQRDQALQLLATLVARRVAE